MTAKMQSYVLAHSIPEPNSGCWLWLRYVNQDGYPRMSHEGKVRGVHRISFAAFKGAIPSGYVVDHMCRVRSCVNPDHLQLVTPTENQILGTKFRATERLRKIKNGAPAPLVNARSDLTASALKERLSYDHESGLFTWKASPSQRPQWNGRYNATMAGRTMATGYRGIRINDVHYLEHRLAWLYVTGDWPAGRLDHINGIRHDNRFANLRVANASENSWNSKLRRDNTSGVRGVTRLPSGQFFAQITVHKIHISIGYFDTLEAAKTARRIAARQYHGAFCSDEDQT